MNNVPKCECGDPAMYVVTGYHVVYVCPDGLGTAIEVAFVDGAESVDVKEIPAQEVSV